MKGKGRYQKPGRKLYRKNLKKRNKIRDRLERLEKGKEGEKLRVSIPAVSIPADKLEDVHYAQDCKGNEWVIFKRRREEDHYPASSSSSSSRRTTKSRRLANPWSAQEEEDLEIAVWKYTKNFGETAPWSEIMLKEGHKFKGRTPGNIKDKWRNMTKEKNHN